MTSATTIPVIDISPFRTGDSKGSEEVVAAVRSACEDTGFFMVSGHGVPETLIEEVYGAGIGFFDLPDEQKNLVAKPSPQVNRGHTAFKSKTVGKGIDSDLKPSLQEGYAMGMMNVPDDPYFHNAMAGTNFAPNIWPAQPPTFEPAMRRYYAAMERLSDTIMHVFAKALDLPEDFFSSKMDRHISTLRLVYYPALRQAPEKGEERAGAHTDTGTLTILRIDDSPEGLQVKTRSGEWVDVKRVPGVFIINIGDMMMRWTNDRWVSTLHRVANPSVASAKPAARQSIVYFNQPNYDAEIACISTCCGPDNPPRYPTITSGEHRLKRYAQTYGFDLAKAG
jgi:isopenicillin N synthase-like dioxygenase